MAAPETFIGQGKVFMAQVINGVKQKLFWVGDASALSFSHEVSDKKEHYESHTGSRQLYDSTGGKKKVSMSLTMHERKTETLAMVLQATKETVPATTGKTASADNLSVGDYWALGDANISNLAIVDSQGTPQPLAEGTDYTIDSAFGLIEILNTDNLTQPFDATYDAGARTIYKPMASNDNEYYLEYHCQNEAGRKEKSLVKAYRVKPDPTSAFDLINEDFAGMSLEGECLLDTNVGAAYTVEYPE